MAALAGQESNGRYDAHNKSFGAYGKYQILPRNWPAWAAEAGLERTAAQTPDNQERVVKHKLMSYFHKYGSWREVAAAWYSGKAHRHNDYMPLRNGTGPSVGKYVDSVMARMQVQSQHAK